MDSQLLAEIAAKLTRARRIAGVVGMLAFLTLSLVLLLFRQSIGEGRVLFYASWFAILILSFIVRCAAHWCAAAILVPKIADRFIVPEGAECEGAFVNYKTLYRRTDNKILNDEIKDYIDSCRLCQGAMRGVVTIIALSAVVAMCARY